MKSSFFAPKPFRGVSHVFFFGQKEKWQISSTLIWQPIRQRFAKKIKKNKNGEEGAWQSGYMCDISHDIQRVEFSKSFFRSHLSLFAFHFFIFAEFCLPRNWIKQPEMTNETAFVGLGNVCCCCGSGGGICACVREHVCTRNFPFVNFSLSFDCRFSRFRHWWSCWRSRRRQQQPAENAEKPTAAAAWQPDRRNNKNNEQEKLQQPL